MGHYELYSLAVPRVIDGRDRFYKSSPTLLYKRREQDLPLL
jgi:hypothetical protein